MKKISTTSIWDGQQKPWYLLFGIFVVKLDLDFLNSFGSLGSRPSQGLMERLMEAKVPISFWI